MPNPVLTQAARQKNVANMLATLRIEKLSPSESLKPSLQGYVDGHKTTTDLLNEVKAKYVALRRGGRVLHPRRLCFQEGFFCCFDFALPLFNSKSKSHVMIAH